MHNKNVRRNRGSRTSHLWQSRQSRSVEAEFQIFGSPGKDEMRKWTYPYFEVLAEQVWKMNEIFRVLPERKYGKQIFGSQGSAKVRKHNFTTLKVPAEMKCGSGLIHTWKSWQNKCERPTRSFEVLTERKYGKRNFRSLAVKAEQKCESGTSHLWRSRQT